MYYVLQVFHHTKFVWYWHWYISNHQNHTTSRDFNLAIIQILYDFDELQKSANYVRGHAFCGSWSETHQNHTNIVWFFIIPHVPRFSVFSTYNDLRNGNVNTWTFMRIIDIWCRFISILLEATQVMGDFCLEEISMLYKVVFI